MIRRLLGRFVYGRRKARRYRPEFDIERADLWHASSRPKFFFTPDRVGSLYADIPTVRRKLIETATDADYRTGLPVYASTAPPLSTDFPWDGRWTPSADRLYRYRPHRFGFLARHCLQIATGRLDAERLSAVVDGWMTFAAGDDRQAGNAYPSTLLVEQRLFALHWGIHLLLGADRPDAVQPLIARLSAILGADVRFLLPRIGHSAPNNHLLADRFAGWYLHAMLPELAGDAVDATTAGQDWLAELLRQTYDDGTGFEHSTHYHEFGCEAGLAYLLLSRVNGWPVRAEAVGRIERMVAFQAALCGPAGIPKRIGNATEDALIAFDAGEGVSTGALREACRRLWSPELEATEPNAPAIEKAIFMTADTEPTAPTGRMVEPAVQHWPDGGFVSLRLNEAGYRLLLRTGPASQQTLFPGHLHADLLSLSIDRGGTPLIEDAGTLTYRMTATEEADSSARGYFEGPLGHSGPVIDGCHPFGTLTGDFRGTAPSAHVDTRVSEQDDRIRVDGRIVSDNAYDGWRRTVWQAAAGYWLIVDRPGDSCKSGALVQFQCAPGVTIETGADRQRCRLLTQQRGRSGQQEGLFFMCSVPIRLEDAVVSYAYGEKIASSKLVCELERGVPLLCLIRQTQHADEPDPVIDWLPGQPRIAVTIDEHTDSFEFEAPVRD